MIALGVERRGELQDVGRAKLDAKATTLTSLCDDNYGAFDHGEPLLP
jgi:hypothetical protein